MFKEWDDDIETPREVFTGEQVTINNSHWGYIRDFITEGTSVQAETADSPSYQAPSEIISAPHVLEPPEVSKNLLPISLLNGTFTGTDCTVTIDGSKIVMTPVVGTTGVSYLANRLFSTPIRLPSIQYTFSHSTIKKSARSNYAMVCLLYSKVSTPSNLIEVVNNVAATSEDILIHGIRIYFRTVAGDAIIEGDENIYDALQLERGSYATYYEPYYNNDPTNGMPLVSRNLWNPAIILSNNTQVNGVYTLKYTDTQYDHLITLPNLNNTLLLKPNTLYTLIFVVSRNTMNQYLSLASSATSVWTATNEKDVTVSNLIVNANATGTVIMKRKTKADFTGANYGLWLHHGLAGVGQECDIKIFLCEGDYNGDFRPYYNSPEDSEYYAKIAAASTFNTVVHGENLLNWKYLVARWKQSHLTLAGEVVDAGYDCFFLSNGFAGSGLVPILLHIFKQNTQYTLSFKARIGVGTAFAEFQIYYTDGTISYYRVNNTAFQDYIFTSTVGKTISRLSIGNSNQTAFTYYVKNTFCFNEGTSANYSQYYHQTYNQVIKDSTGKYRQLRGSKDSTIRDSVNWSTGEGITKIRQSVVTSGTRPFNWNYGEPAWLNPIYCLLSARDGVNKWDISTNSFNCFSSIAKVSSGFSALGFYCYINPTATELRLIVPKSELTSNGFTLDRAGAQAWINNQILKQQVITDSGKPLLQLTGTVQQPFDAFTITGKATQVETVTGKNLSNAPNVTETFTTGDSYKMAYLGVSLPVGTTVTVSWDYNFTVEPSTPPTAKIQLAYEPVTSTFRQSFDTPYPNTTSGRVAITFTIPTFYPQDLFLHRETNAGTAVPCTVNISNVMVALGNDSTYEPFIPNSPSPEASSPIKTTGTSTNVTACGENLFEHTRPLTQTLNGVTVIFDKSNNEYTINGTSTASGAINLNQSFSYQGIIVPCAGKTMLLSYQYISGTKTSPVITDVLFIIGKSTGNNMIYNLMLTNETTTATFFATEDCNHYRLYFNAGVVFDNYKIKIQFSTSPSLLTYQSYIGSTTPITFRDTDGNLHDLSSAPDGTADEVDVYSGQGVDYCKTRNNITVSNVISILTNTIRFAVNGTQSDTSEAAQKILSNRFIGILESVADVEHVGNGGFNKIVFVWINKSRIGYVDGDTTAQILTKANAWLTTNPTSILYKLATPIPWTLHPDERKQILAQNGVTNIFTDNEIPPNLSASQVHTEYNPIVFEYPLAQEEKWELHPDEVDQKMITSQSLKIDVNTDATVQPTMSFNAIHYSNS